MGTDGRQLFGNDSERVDRLLALGLDDFDAAPESSSAVSLVRLLGAPDDQIDRYKLIGILGEGGYGIVYLAEQQEPVKRRVALKVIKPGMDSRQVIARFEAERQALALLDHPNIARVFEAGTTSAGRPYFAMEYVQGVPITAYCDKCKLDTQERLRLFIPLCQAVQHAHHKGIIHRDIKPSNALVPLHDDKPVPKVIDFGIAKALHQRLTERTLVTEKGECIGTPEYMSPEQAELAGLDVDTRTDIYSLGVLLYELLTGCTPFDPAALRSKGYAEMQRIICAQDPPRLSTKLTTLGDRAEDIARHRRVTAEQLRKAVRGDLDWIVMKAMEKDRARRYATANDLAEDIERHLNNEPVAARPPSTLYQFQKLVRRNKAVFAGLALVASVFALATLVSTWQAIRATQARHAESRLREQAEAGELAMRQLAYASDVRLAQQALAMNDLGRARRLLQAHRPRPGEVDLRGWEWRCLWQESRSDAIAELCRYPKSAHSLAYSPDGRLLAVAGFPVSGYHIAGVGFVEVWDVPARKRVTTLQANEGHLVAFSPRGDLLATAAGPQIRLWQTGTWDRVHQLTVAWPVQVLRFSPDGKHLASLSHPDEVTVWEVDQWALVRHIRDVKPLAYHLGAMSFSPDGTGLVIGDADHRLHVVDLADGSTRLDIPEAHPEAIASVVWSPDGSIIASAGGYTSGSIRLWDVASGKPLGPLEGHTSWVCDLIFSEDSQWLYSAGADQTIRIWDVGERQCLAVLQGSTDEVHGLALSPDGATLASACKDGAIAFWNARPHPGEEQPRLIVSGEFAQPAFAPSSRVLAVLRGGTVCLDDLATSKEIEQLPALGADVVCVAYSPDGRLLAGGVKTGEIRVWSCAECRLLAELDDPKVKVPMHLLRFRADGRRLLSIDAVSRTTWWDTFTWQPVGAFTLGPFARAVELSPDGRLLAVGTATGAVRWLNVETGELLAVTDTAHWLSVTGIAFSRDGMRAASTADDGMVVIWDPFSFQPITAFKGHMHAANGVAFSPDGRRLLTGGGALDSVKLWDLSTLRELLALPGQDSLFDFVAVSPDDRWLAARGQAGILHLWHAPSWEEIEVAEREQTSGQSP